MSKRKSRRGHVKNKTNNGIAINKRARKNTFYKYLVVREFNSTKKAKKWSRNYESNT